MKFVVSDLIAPLATRLGSLGAGAIFALLAVHPQPEQSANLENALTAVILICADLIASRIWRR